MSKVIWAGGPHGVGKTSSLKLTVAGDTPLNYLYLGRMFYETADKMGYKWMELKERDNLLKVEEKVTEKMKEKIKNSDLLIDCHFAIHFGNDRIYPGFHAQNLQYLFSDGNSKKGVLSLTADPNTIMQRRGNCEKKIKSYLTKEDKETIKKEINDSADYFDYFVNALGPDVTSMKLDTSDISLENVVNKIEGMYHEM